MHLLDLLDISIFGNDEFHDLKISNFLNLLKEENLIQFTITKIFENLSENEFLNLEIFLLAVNILILY